MTQSNVEPGPRSTSTRASRATRATSVLVIAWTCHLSTPGAALAEEARISEPGAIDVNPCDEDLEELPRPTFAPFSRRSVRVSITLGLGSTSLQSYVIVGGGVGYYVVDGLEIGADYEAWLLDTPVLHRVTPEMRYVLQLTRDMKPYLGVFYRHTFVVGHDDFDGLGARIGAYYAPASARAYFGGGLVYEHVLDCSHDAFVSCDATYPEAFLGTSF